MNVFFCSFLFTGLLTFISHCSVNHGKHAQSAEMWILICLFLLGIATDGITALLRITIL